MYPPYCAAICHLASTELCSVRAKQCSECTFPIAFNAQCAHPAPASRTAIPANPALKVAADLKLQDAADLVACMLCGASSCGGEPSMAAEGQPRPCASHNHGSWTPESRGRVRYIQTLCSWTLCAITDPMPRGICRPRILGAVDYSLVPRHMLGQMIHKLTTFLMVSS
jgi:hypothetical protein